MGCKDIIIIGGGWYGCHCASLLKNKHKVTILEKNAELFDNSSYYNQNRLHLGFHYCRNYSTRNLCESTHNKFIQTYGHCVDIIDRNYYLVANESCIDYDTYTCIYKYDNIKFDTINNNIFNNVQKDIIKVKEKVINSNKIKNHFINILKDIPIHFNTTAIKLENVDNKVKVICDNKMYIADIVFDCTYNQLGLSKKQYIYEKTISLLYKKIKENDFDGVTIVDGKFCSIYPRIYNDKIYTLTDVEHTPMIKSFKYNDVKDYTPSDTKLINIINKMEKKIKYYYPKFGEEYNYIDYFLSNKTKMISNSDSRDICIENLGNNIITVNCGKIVGIFDFENYIRNDMGLL